VIWTAFAIRRVAMPGHDDLHAHLGGTLHDGLKIVYLEPQQNTVSVWLVITIADRTVIMFYVETVQLKDELAVRDQSLIFGAAMIAPAAQQTLIPSAARFYVGYGDERLRTHPKQRSISSLRLTSRQD
jgi:hypothetical protein